MIEPSTFNPEKVTSIMASIKTLKPGQTAKLRFHGSSNLGNAPWEDTCTLVSITEDRAVFGDPHNPTQGQWEAYFSQRRWRYGTSAEVLSLISVEKTKPQQ